LDQLKILSLVIFFGQNLDFLQISCICTSVFYEYVSKYDFSSGKLLCETAIAEETRMTTLKHKNKMDRGNSARVWRWKKI